MYDSQKYFLPPTEHCSMEIDLRPASDLGPPSEYCRPAAIFLGLCVFLVGVIVLGAALAAGQSRFLLAYTGSLLAVLGVSIVGGALVMAPSEHWLDPDIEFDGPQRYLVTAVSVLFLLFAVVALVAG